MFDHLDDPRPPVVGDDARRAVESRRARLARRRRIAYSAAASAVLVATGTGIALGATAGRGTAVRIQTRPQPSVPAPHPTTTVVRRAAPTVETTLQASLPPVPLICAELTPVGHSGPVVATAVNGRFKAVLSGTLDLTAPAGPVLNHPRLVVIADGRTLLDEAVVAPNIPPEGFTRNQVIAVNLVGPLFGTSYPTSAYSPMCLARFAGAAVPTVLFGFYAGGAHCCVAVRAVPLGPGAPGPSDDLGLGNATATVEVHEGRVIVLTADNRFAYAFSSFAGSGMPVMAYEVSGGHFVLKTRDYPDLIRSDAARWWQQVVSTQNGGQGILGVLAAWVADECQIGRSASAWATVDTLNAQGKLTGPSAPTGTAYVAALRTFLSKTGYC